MSLIRRHWPLGLVLLVVLAVASPAQAVPPPDFIINVGSQMAQFFSLALLFLTAIISSAYQFLRVRFASARMKRSYWIAGICLVILVSAIGAKVFGAVLQERALAKLNLSQEVPLLSNDADPNVGEIAAEGAADLDQALASSSTLSAMNPDVPVIVPEAVVLAAVPPIVSEDPVTQFIRRYYRAIAAHEFRTAYDMSKKTVSYETFVSWYAETNAITINTLQRIDATRSSFELKLDESTGQSRYTVTMTIDVDATGAPLRIANSSARLLEQRSVQAGAAAAAAVTALPKAATTTLPFKLSNQGLKTLLRDSSARYSILDAREDLEYEYGNFPGSTHIRFADLKAGRWVELPTDRPIIVLCWSGIRGSQVASFLRQKKIVASYLAEGANGWVAAGGTWQGTVKFAERFPEERYRLAFSKEEAMRRVQGGAILVDAREPADRTKFPLKTTAAISLLSTPTVDLETRLAQIPPGSKVITVCGGYVDCFEAKLVGVALERSGQVFLGRYYFTP